MPLRERPWCAIWCSSTRALYDLADRSAWLAVLRAPWCGARLATLTALSGRNERQLIIEALGNPERLARCAAERPAAPRARARSARRGARAARARSRVADWLEGTWVRLGAADAYRAEELDDARAFFAALAERAAPSEWRGPEDFAGAAASICYSAAGGAERIRCR